MEDVTSTEHIQDFLLQMRNLIQSRNYDFVPRKKNMQALIDCGMTIKDAKEELLNLTVTDYYKGPKRDFDHNRPGDIWEFKKKIDELKIYIKVKIVHENNKKVLRCLAFHKDEYA